MRRPEPLQARQWSMKSSPWRRTSSLNAMVAEAIYGFFEFEKRLRLEEVEPSASMPSFFNRQFEFSLSLSFVLFPYSSNAPRS